MTSRTEDFPQSDRFQVLRRLGAGSFGVVYAAHDRERGEQVALKTLRRDIERLRAALRVIRDEYDPDVMERIGSYRLLLFQKDAGS